MIPLVTHGVTTISRLQVWTQPLWLAMLVLPFVYLCCSSAPTPGGLMQFGGIAPGGTLDDVQPAGFDLMKPSARRRRWVSR